MAFDKQTQNAITEIINEGAAALENNTRYINMVARFNQNGIYAKLVNAADFAAFPDFAHLNQSKVGNAIAAFNALVAALGDISNAASDAAFLNQLKG